MGSYSDAKEYFLKFSSDKKLSKSKTHLRSIRLKCVHSEQKKRTLIRSCLIKIYIPGGEKIKSSIYFQSLQF